MTGAGVIAAAAAAPGAAAEAVRVAQLTSEDLGLTVAALIALAVLAVLGGVVIVVLRREGQARAVRGQGGEEPAAHPPEDGLWAASGADAGNGAGAAVNGADSDRAPAPDTAGDARAGEDDAPSRGVERPRRGSRLRPAARETAEPAPAGDERLLVRPPELGEAWVAEIVWAAHATRFRVVARRSEDPDAEPVAIAQTEPLPWPPRDDASVQALTDASTTLEAVLLDSGWSALPTGEAWYSKRFAWAPAAAPEPPPSTGRFDRRRAGAPDPAPAEPVAQDAGSLRH